jgi:hypothetical protein
MMSNKMVVIQSFYSMLYTYVLDTTESLSDFIHRK